MFVFLMRAQAGSHHSGRGGLRRGPGYSKFVDSDVEVDSIIMTGSCLLIFPAESNT
jgi:hypothetical protein